MTELNKIKETRKARHNLMSHLDRGLTIAEREKNTQRETVGLTSKIMTAAQKELSHKIGTLTQVHPSSQRSQQFSQPLPLQLLLLLFPKKTVLPRA
jgi:hypothetical protein